jgi:hypothetical protein
LRFGLGRPTANCETVNEFDLLEKNAMPWSSLFQRPEPFLGDETTSAWFPRLADRLLNGCELILGTRAHRFTEVEVYYHGPGHADPFTHRDPVQQQLGRWYFHRSNGTYRSGSFKGVDLAFGDSSAFAGVLIRGLEKPNGDLVDGPSLCVDYLLDATGAGTVAALDKAIAGRLGWESGNPLLLRQTSEIEQRPLFRSGRIGLTLKRARGHAEMPRFVLRAYRFLTQPKRISKGRLLLVLALHAQGESPQQIQQTTGCTRGAIDRYIADFEAGSKQVDFAPFVGKDLTPADLARLHGVWHASFGPVPSH